MKARQEAGSVNIELDVEKELTAHVGKSAEVVLYGPSHRATPAAVVPKPTLLDGTSDVEVSYNPSHRATPAAVAPMPTMPDSTGAVVV